MATDPPVCWLSNGKGESLLSVLRMTHHQTTIKQKKRERKETRNREKEVNQGSKKSQHFQFVPLKASRFPDDLGWKQHEEEFVHPKQIGGVGIKNKNSKQRKDSK